MSDIQALGICTRRLADGQCVVELVLPNQDRVVYTTSQSGLLSCISDMWRVVQEPAPGQFNPTSCGSMKPHPWYVGND